MKLSEENCNVEGCDRKVHAKGLCCPHAHRLRKYGDPLGKPSRPTEQERFWSKVNKTPQCWEWTASVMNRGYGTFTDAAGTKWLTHRYAYTQKVGAIPGDLVLDHLCRNKRCVNPVHLEPVDRVENMRRGDGWAVCQGRRDSCINGHEYTPENTYRAPGRPNLKRCRQCARDSEARRTRNRTTNEENTQ